MQWSSIQEIGFCSKRSGRNRCPTVEIRLCSNNKYYVHPGLLFDEFEDSDLSFKSLIICKCNRYVRTSMSSQMSEISEDNCVHSQPNHYSRVRLVSGRVLPKQGQRVNNGPELAERMAGHPTESLLNLASTALGLQVFACTDRQC